MRKTIYIQTMQKNDIMEILKMAEIMYRQMPVPRDLPQQISTARAKIRMQKPANFWCKSLEVQGGGVVTAKIDNRIPYPSWATKTLVPSFEHAMHLGMSDP